MTNFDFDDFDTQINCEEMSGPTDQELQELMAEGQWEEDTMYPYGEEMPEYSSPEELMDIFRSLGFNVITFE
jgi:hypothetical protein